MPVVLLVTVVYLVLCVCVCVCEYALVFSSVAFWLYAECMCNATYVKNIEPDRRDIDVLTTRRLMAAESAVCGRTEGN